jgi:amino acid adenylation domain-containing protein
MPAPQKLTQRQLLFWLGQNRQPEVPLYNMVVEFDLRGPVDAERMSAAFQELVRRSDALRSVFHETQEGVVREVREDFESPFSYVRLGPGAEAARRLEALLSEAAATKFDLQTCCFLAGLVQLEPERHVLFIVQHHLIGDGASIRLLYSALMQIYAGGDPGPIGSAALALSQQDAYLASPRAADDAEYWTARRQSRRDATRFFARTVPHGDSQVTRVEVALDAQQSAVLMRGGVEDGVVFPDLAALALLETIVLAYLHRVTGEREQALGTPVRNRQGRAGRTAVGCFIEVVPIQAEVDPEDSFLDLLSRVRAATMEALAHGQHCVSNPDSRPLFDVTVNYHVEKYTAPEGLAVTVRFWTGLHAFRPKALGAQTLAGDSLGVHCHDYTGSGRLTLWLDFHALHFDAAQRKRATAHLLSLLDAAVRDPAQRIAAVDLVDAEERTLILEHSRGPTCKVDPGRTFVHDFEDQVRLGPDRPAIAFGEVTWSYAQLAQQVDRVAAGLRAAGLSAEAPVAILMERSPLLVATMLGVFKVGGASVPLDPHHPPSRIAHVLEVAQPALVIMQRSAAVERPGGAQVLFLEDLPPVGKDDAWNEARADGIAYVLFTSGSSGKPKGVQIEHRALSNFLASMRREPGLQASDRVLGITTVTFDIAGLELYLPLSCGACIELLDEATAANPAALRSAIEEKKPTLVQATPTGFRLLREAGWAGQPLRVVIGGEPLPPDLAEWLVGRVTEVWNAYGPTETTVWSTLKKVDPAQPFPITIGRPIDNTTCFVMNESRRLAPIGVPGELYIGGTGLARGYHADPGQTSAKFVSDAPELAPRLYRTGDLAVLRPDGEFECLGRADFQLKIRGFRVEPGDIEHALAQHEGVAASVVIGLDIPGGKALAAYVVARPGITLDVPDLRNHVSALVPPYMVPATFTVLPTLPQTPSGKVDRKALPAPDVGASDDESAPVSLRTDLEIQVAAAFEEVLKRTPISRNDDFFELGGHSLLALDLTARLDRIAGRALGIGLIFEHRRVSAMAAAIAEGGRADGPIIMELNRGAAGIPLFCMRGVHIYRDLATALGSLQRVIGIHLPAEERLMRVEGGDGEPLRALARAYIAAMKQVQPLGPYRVAGISFAGVLAYEIAQQLLAAGEKVESITLFDTVLTRSREREWFRWGREQVGRALRGGKLVRTLRRLLPASAEVEADVEGWRMKAFAGAVRKYEPTMQALVRPCKTLLFRAGDRPSHPGWVIRPDLGWGGLVEGLAVQPVPGDHLELLKQPVVLTVAKAIHRAFSLSGRTADAE